MFALHIIYSLSACLLAGLLATGFGLADAPMPAVARAPDAAPFTVKIVDVDCQRAGEPVQLAYTAVEEAVKDTVPGEWWPPTGYSAPMVGGAFKSAAIIIRTRISYHAAQPLYSTAAYATANVDWPGGQQLPLGCGEWQMNTILPKPVNAQQGGSYWGSQSNFQSNSAVDTTAGTVVVRETGGPIVAEWNPQVENRTVVCNYQSRDWSFCALNALAEFLNSPWGQNRLARRLNTSSNSRTEFQSEAHNLAEGRSSPQGWHSWNKSTSADGTGTDGSTWSGTGFSAALPNSGAGFGGGENYQVYSPVMTYRVAFPQSGTYYVWVRGLGGSASDDSVHAGLDDNRDGAADSATALDMAGWMERAWRWSNLRMGGQRATVAVSGESFHTVKVWMREDGMRVDRILLTTDPNYVPR